MKKKLMILVPVLLLLSAGGAYEMVLKPKPKVVVPKVNGTLVSLGDPFTVNLSGGHYGRITVAVLSTLPPVASPDSSTPSLLPENDALRAVVTDDLTGVSSSRLIDRAQRHELLAQILADIKKSTDEPITKVLFTDVAVQ